jgi:hypothetical protein
VIVKSTIEFEPFSAAAAAASSRHRSGSAPRQPPTPPGMPRAPTSRNSDHTCHSCLVTTTVWPWRRLTSSCQSFILLAAPPFCLQRPRVRRCSRARSAVLRVPSLQEEKEYRWLPCSPTSNNSHLLSFSRCPSLALSPPHMIWRHEAACNALSEVLWRRWRDVATWCDWDPDIESSSLQVPLPLPSCSHARHLPP